MKETTLLSHRFAKPLVMGGLVLLVWGVFAPMLAHDFVNYDDPVYVTQNQFVRGGLSREGVVWALTAFYDGNWFPMTWLSHMLDVSLYGLQAGGHHLTSLLLHTVNTLLVFVVFRHMTGRTAPSAVLAALFAIHPLHVEPVAWIAQRKELLAATFGLMAMGAYSRYRQKPGKWRYLAIMALFSLSLAAKPMWVTFPVLMILLDIWPYRRLAPAEQGTVRKLCHLIAEKVPLIALSLVSSLLMLFTQHRGGAVRSLQEFTVFERAGNAVTAYGQYLLKTLWPGRLAVYYPHPGSSLPGWQVGVSALFLLLVTGFVFRRLSRQPYLAAGWLWYLISLLPVIGIVQIGTQAMAGRYTYLPLIGIFLAVVWWGAELSGRFRFGRAAFGAACVAVVALLAVNARAELRPWKNGVTLFERSLAVTGPNPVALINLGTAYANIGRIAESEEMYRQAVRIAPENAQALFNLGVALRNLGKPAEAEKVYRKALSLKPNYADAAANLGGVLAEDGRYQEALYWYRAALAAGGETAGLHGNLGNLMGLLGRKREAVDHFRRALLLAPNNALIHCNYAIVLEGDGKIEEAIAHYSEAIRLAPRMTAPYCRVAHLLEKRGQMKGARRFVEMARRQDPAACAGGVP